jgi:molecular chaperone Hsp33
VSAAQAIPLGETGFDQLLGFTIPLRHARGRVVRLGPVLDVVLSAHDYPLPIKHLLAEALVLTALIGSLLKDDGSQLTIQAQTQGGIVELLACDFREGALRGYVRHDSQRLGMLGANPSLNALFGEAYLAITFDDADSGQRYQGIVPIEGDSLSKACEAYFAQSEQVPTLMRTAVKWDGRHCIAAGLLAQNLAEGEQGRERLHVRLDHPEWEHVAVLAGSIRHEELVDPELSLETMIWRLFHEEQEVRVDPLARISRGCRCSYEHYRDVLSRFPDSEREDMRDDDGLISVDCAFCSKIFTIDL